MYNTGKKKCIFGTWKQNLFLFLQACSVNLFSAETGRRLLDTTLIFNMDPNGGKPEKVCKVPRISCGWSLSQGFCTLEHYYFQSRWLYFVCWLTHNKIFGFSVTHFYFVFQLFVQAFLKKDDSVGYRVMVQTEDHTLTFIQQPGMDGEALSIHELYCFNCSKSHFTSGLCGVEHRADKELLTLTLIL